MKRLQSVLCAFLHCASMSSIRIFTDILSLSKRDHVTTLNHDFVSHRVPVVDGHKGLVVLVPHILAVLVRHILAEAVHRRTTEVHHTPAAAFVVHHILVVGAHHMIPVRNHLQMDSYYSHHPVAKYHTCSSD